MQKALVLAAVVGGITLTGCKTMDSGNIGSIMETGSTAMKAMTLTDADVVSVSNESCEALDAENKIAPANNKYTQRLNKVIAKMPKEIDGKKAVYKVYLTQDVNAWAMANGCIRVYSGLMDLMNDDELRGVIGHEIGHVALGHSKKAMQTAYATAAVRQAAASSSGAIGQLSRSEAGAVGEKFLNAQFSQSQETDSDNYSFDLLTKLGMERKGLVTAFQKLAKLGGGGGNSLMSSHPPSDARAKNMQTRLDAKK